MATKKVNNKLTCTRCGAEKVPTTGFYLSHSLMYKHNKGRMPICKDCVVEKFRELKNEYNDDKKALYHLTMMLDVYFNEELVESAYKQCGDSTTNEDGLVKIYFQKVNSLMQYKGKNSIQSDKLILDMNILNNLENQYKLDLEEKKKNKEIYDDIVNDPDIIKRWGTGWKAEEYKELEEKYQEWMDHYEHDTLAQQKLFRELSELEVQKSKARMEGDKNAYKNLSELVSKKMSDANIKPAQKKILGEEDGDVLGVMIREIENNQPIAECLPQFKDVDKIESLIVRTFLKPFARVYGLASGEEEIELNDEMKESLEKSKKVNK